MSTLRLTTLSNQGGTATVPSDTVINGTAKAWVNFNGTGTVAIRQSFNVGSITDHGTGDYTINFTSSLVDANYAVSQMTGAQPGVSLNVSATLSTDIAVPTTSGFRVQCRRRDTNSDVDVSYANFIVVR